MPDSPGAALRIELRASRGAGVALAAMYLGAALGALALPLPPWIALIAGCALIPSAWRTLSRHAFRRGADAIVGMACTRSTGWRLTTARGESMEGCVLSSAFVHPRLIVARFSTPRGRIGVMVPAGAADPDEARRLRVALRRIAVRSMGPGGGGA